MKKSFTFISSAFERVSQYVFQHVFQQANRLVLIILSFICAVSLSACSVPGIADSSDSSASDSGLTTVTFMLSWAPDTNHIGVYVAQQLGYFKKAGLKVNIVATSQAGAEQSVSNGVADFALSNLSNVADSSIKNAGLKFVLQVQQKASAIWCSLASNTSISSPKDFDGKTFATFGGNESDAVVKAMIKNDGGTGTFDKVTVGTSTFNTLSTGKADFGGFYTTWEGVQAELYGPKLNCFTEADYGIPGNADEIGIISSSSYLKENPTIARKFIQAAQRGYYYAYTHPDKAARILVKAASSADLKYAFVKRSMQVITSGEYWGSLDDVKSGNFAVGSIDTASGQKYFDFLFESGAYTDEDNQPIANVPVAKKLVTSKYLLTAKQLLNS